MNFEIKINKLHVFMYHSNIKILKNENPVFKAIQIYLHVVS